MKLRIIFLILINLVTYKAIAQENFSQGIGIYTSFKAGINATEQPSGRKTGIAFNGIPDFGIVAYVPVSETSQLAALIDIGYSNYSFITSNERPELEVDDITHKYAYVAISPKFYFHSAMFGFRFGMPVSSDIDGADTDIEDLGFMAEVILGGMFPIYNDETGRFNLFFELSYMLSGVYKDYEEDDPLKEIIPASIDQNITNAFNPRVASISLGFNYMFNF